MSTTKSYAVKSGSPQSIQNTRDAIRNREPFQTHGSMQGVSGNYGRTGWLSPDEKQEFERVANHIVYTVLSYGTPIAYAYEQDADGFLPSKSGKPVAKIMWHVVEQRFSVTTSAHQSQVYAALNGRRRTPQAGIPEYPYGDPQWLSGYQDDSITYEGL